MNKLMKTISTTALSFGLLVGASSGFAAIYEDLGQYDFLPADGGNVYSVSMATDDNFIVADDGTSANLYLLEGEPMNQSDLEAGLALTTDSSFMIETFDSSGGSSYPGLTGGLTSGTYDIGIGYSFTGFLIKAGGLSLVAIFDSAIQSLSWNTAWTGEFNDLFHTKYNQDGSTNHASDNALSHVAVLNAVPIPAAAFLFAPALLGFFGLRRRANKTIA